MDDQKKDKDVEDQMGISQQFKKKMGDEERNPLQKMFKSIGDSSMDFYKKNKTPLKYLAIAITNLLIFAYFITAVFYWIRHGDSIWEWCDGFGFLVIMFSIVYFFLIYFHVIKKYFGSFLQKFVLKPIGRVLSYFWKFSVVRWVVGLLVLGGIAVYLGFDTAGNRHRLVSLIGLCTILGLGFIFSHNQSKIKWRTVIGGLLIQFLIGLFTIRWVTGRLIFECIGDKVATFLDFAREGAGFVFGDFLVNKESVFAFSALPTIVFFSMLVEMMFYVGAIQWVCGKLGWFLQATLGTTVCESTISAANTFIGQTESPLLIRPYLPLLTKSEFHTVMAAGFATVSGTVLKAYICFGANPALLITASIMAAPGVLAFSKLFYPEEEESKTTSDNIQIIKSEETTLLGAASKGCSISIPLAFNIAANLIGFVSFVAFFNAVLGWFGGLVGLEWEDEFGAVKGISLEWIMGKVFIPLSWVMGVPWEECETVGELIGLKTMINEFIAYKRLGEYKMQGLSTRAEVIATYSLCGFANPSSIGIMIGGLGALAPERKEDIISVAGRAFVTGCAVCFLTSCIAGVLLGDDVEFDTSNNGTCSSFY